MEIVQRFIEWAILLVKCLLKILALGPGEVYLAFGILTVLFFANEFLKTYLVVEHTRCTIAHIVINMLTILPAVILVCLLLFAGYMHPERVCTNFSFALLALVPWYISGRITCLARNDAEGAGIGFMSIGLLMLIGTGIVTLIIF